MSIPKNFAALGTPLRNGGGRGMEGLRRHHRPPPSHHWCCCCSSTTTLATVRSTCTEATCTRAVKEMLGEKRRKSSKLRQLISSQSGSIRNFFGTAKNLRHRTTGANQPQQQQVEAVAK
ncbi:hypothetical protein niasHS_009812 [Heterodera schachtii]|uniref:Uncharacterized protein n=2 Tax=Heterodera TaxID=34509 RepID=A0ABD2JAG7_HETSC